MWMRGKQYHWEAETWSLYRQSTLMPTPTGLSSHTAPLGSYVSVLWQVFANKWSTMLLQRAISERLVNNMNSMVKKLPLSIRRSHLNTWTWIVASMCVVQFPHSIRRALQPAGRPAVGYRAGRQTHSWQQIRDVIHVHWRTLHKAYIILPLYRVWAKRFPVACKSWGCCPSNLWSWKSKVSSRVPFSLLHAPSVWLYQLMWLHSIDINQK